LLFNTKAIRNYNYRQSINPQRNDYGEMTDTWRMKMSMRAMSIDNISFLSPPMTKTFDYEKQTDDGEINGYNNEAVEGATSNTENDQTKLREDDNEDEENNIIPWKRLLRKTNSRLNLIS
jgi:hypothetical protein